MDYTNRVCKAWFHFQCKKSSLLDLILAFFFPRRTKPNYEGRRTNPNYEGEKKKKKTNQRDQTHAVMMKAPRGGGEGSRWWQQGLLMFLSRSFSGSLGFLIVVVSLWISLGLLTECCYLVRGEWEMERVRWVKNHDVSLDFVGFVIVDGVVSRFSRFRWVRWICWEIEFYKLDLYNYSHGNRVLWTWFITPKSSLLHSRC